MTHLCPTLRVACLFYKRIAAVRLIARAFQESIGLKTSHLLRLQNKPEFTSGIPTPHPHDLSAHSLLRSCPVRVLHPRERPASPIPVPAAPRHFPAMVITVSTRVRELRRCISCTVTPPTHARRDHAVPGQDQLPLCAFTSAKLVCRFRKVNFLPFSPQPLPAVCLPTRCVSGKHAQSKNHSEASRCLGSQTLPRGESFAWEAE